MEHKHSQVEHKHSNEEQEHHINHKPEKTTHKNEEDCCSVEKETHNDDDGHNHDEEAGFKLFLAPIISLILLLTAIAFDNWIPQAWFKGWVRIAWYVASYLPVGFPVIKSALISIKNKDVFSEFFLMTIATLGAFALGEYPEAVAVMLFYAVGEVFQTMAVSRAKANIKSLLDQRPDTVTVLENNTMREIKAEKVPIGSIVQLKPGEKLALDGELFSETASFNTAALTGESKPDTKYKGEKVLAGMINLNAVSQVLVNTAYNDSKLSKILELVQSANKQKAPTELFIRKFAKIYTPIVVALAVLICILPAFFVQDYQFKDWLYRALVFLVISCPCALVISIPLGYFGGIGAASKNGILVKGSSFLDKLSNIQNVVTDKTGTLTEGVFEVQEVNLVKGQDKNSLLEIVNALEARSSHPIGTAIKNHVGDVNPNIKLENIEEIAGHGLVAEYKGSQFMVGNFKLLDKFGITYDSKLSEIVNTVVAIAYDKQYVGHIVIADSIKPDAKLAVSRLHTMGVKVTMLSGDKSSVVKNVAETLEIDQAFGDLLPEGKVEKVQEIKNRNESVAFVGDGINDAPVVALSDVGIAMGGLGSDATIETADVVIQDDKPSKIPRAIKIGKETKKIVWQNITLAFVVKAIVLILGAGGLATMWEAVFADVGVALIAVLNAVRIQRMEFE